MSTTISGDNGVTFPDATTQSKAVSQATPFSVTASAGAGAQLQLPEATANGSNYVALKSPDSVSSNLTLTLPSADGAAGQYLQTNGSGQLAFATVAGNQITAVASGSIATGASVILNSDGTVSAVSGTVPATGSAATVGTNTAYIAATYDSVNNKVVVSYRNNVDGFGYAVVGTVSGTTITFGTPVQFSSSSTFYTKICYVAAAQRILITYSLGSALWAIAGQVSGTSITFGSAANSGYTGQSFAITEVNGQSRAVVLFDYTGYSPGSQTWCLYSLTISGSTVSWTNFYFQDTSGSTNYYPQMGTPAANKILLAYRDTQYGNGGVYHLSVNSSTGAIASAASRVAFNGSTVNSLSMACDTANSRFFLFFSDTGNGTSVALMRPGAVGASTTTLGSTVTITSSLTGYVTGQNPFYNQDQNTAPVGIYVSSGNRVYVAYTRSSSPGILSGTVSGSAENSTISFDPGVLSSFGSGSGTGSISFAYSGSPGYVVVTATTTGGPLNGLVTNIGISTLTAINFAGFSAGSYTNGQTATVQTVGAVSTNVSGLTAAQKYYVLGDGSLSTTADSRNVYAGLATSATSILVKG